MAVIRQRNDPVKLFWRRLAMLGLVMFVLFALGGVLGVFQKEKDSGKLRAEAETRLHELEKREIALRARIANLETERGQEEALRGAYGVGKEGEAMVQIVEKPTTTKEKELVQEKNWLQKIFGW